MTNKLEMFRCEVCGNVIEVVLSGGGELVCCSKPMTLMIAKEHDLGEEKHVPSLEVIGEEKIVRIGDLPHPMEENHYIQFIEVISNDHKWVKRKYLSPNEAAEMSFKCKCNNGFEAFENCNVHGFWSKKFKGE